MRDLQRGDDGEGGGLGSIYATESPGPASNKPSGLSFAVPPNPPPKASSTSLVYHEPQPVSRVPSQFQDPDYQLTQRQGPSVSSRGKKHKNHHRASDESYYRDDYEDSGGGGYDVPARSGQMSFASGLTGGGGMRRGAGGEEASVVAPMVEALKAQMETFANVMAQQQQQQLVQAQQQQQMLQQQQQQIFQQQQQMIQQMATPPIQPSYLPRGQQQQLSPPNRSIQNDNNSMVNDFLPPSNNVKSDREDIRYTDVDSQPRTPNGNDDDELTDHFPLPGSGTDEEETRGVDAKRQGKASQMDIDRARANEATDRTPRIDKARNEAAGGAGGSGTVAVESDDLSVFVHMAGPLEKKGTYRLRVVLYDGFQPLTAGPGLVVGASTSRRKATGDGDEGALTATWNDTAVLRGLRVSPTMMLVFEVYLAKVNVAGLPTHEALIAWGYTSLVTPQGEVRAYREGGSD